MPNAVFISVLLLTTAVALALIESVISNGI